MSLKLLSSFGKIPRFDLVVFRAVMKSPFSVLQVPQVADTSCSKFEMHMGDVDGKAVMRSPLSVRIIVDKVHVF